MTVALLPSCVHTMVSVFFAGEFWPRVAKPAQKETECYCPNKSLIKRLKDLMILVVIHTVCVTSAYTFLLIILHTIFILQVDICSHKTFLEEESKRGRMWNRRQLKIDITTQWTSDLETYFFWREVVGAGWYWKWYVLTKYGVFDSECKNPTMCCM